MFGLDTDTKETPQPAAQQHDIPIVALNNEDLKKQAQRAFPYHFGNAATPQPTPQNIEKQGDNTAWGRLKNWGSVTGGNLGAISKDLWDIGKSVTSKNIGNAAHFIQSVRDDPKGTAEHIYDSARDDVNSFFSHPEKSVGNGFDWLKNKGIDFKNNLLADAHVFNGKPLSQEDRDNYKKWNSFGLDVAENIVGAKGIGEGLNAAGKIGAKLAKGGARFSGITGKMEKAVNAEKAAQHAASINNQLNEFDKMKDAYERAKENLYRNPQNAETYIDSKGQLHNGQDIRNTKNLFLERQKGLVQEGMNGDLRFTHPEAEGKSRLFQSDLDHINSMTPFLKDDALNAFRNEIRKAKDDFFRKPYAKKYEEGAGGKITPQEGAFDPAHPNWLSNLFKLNPKTAPIGAALDLGSDALAKRAASQVGKDTPPSAIMKNLNGVKNTAGTAALGATAASLPLAAHNASQQQQGAQNMPPVAPNGQTPTQPPITPPAHTPQTASNQEVPHTGNLFERITNGLMKALTNPELGQIFQGWASQEPGETWSQAAARGYQNQQDYHSRYALLQREGVDPKTAQQLAINPELTKERLQQVWHGRAEKQKSIENSGTAASPYFEKAQEANKEIDRYDQKLSTMQKIKEDFQKRGLVSIAGLGWDEAKHQLTGSTTEAQKIANDANFILEDMPQDFRDQFAEAELKRDPKEMARLLDFAEDKLVNLRKMHLDIYHNYRNGVLPDRS